MAMIPGRRRQAVANPAYQMAGVANQLVEALAPAVKQVVREAIRSGVGSAATRVSRKVAAAKKKGPRKTQAAQGGSSPFQNTYSLGKAVTLNNQDRMRVVQRDVAAFSNGTTAGTQAYCMWLGLASTQTGSGSSASLGYFLPRLVTMAGLYREFVINSITFRWVPNQGYTSTGTVSMGVDPSPYAGIPASYGSVIHHTASKMFDIKSEASIAWKPRTDVKLGPRYTTAGGQDEDELSYGCFQLYSTNGNAASAAIGNVLIEADITFVGAM